MSQAAVTPIRFYHLGEDDSGLGHNVVATNSIDSVSTNALSFTGAPKYWGHAARGNTNSHYSILFSTADKASAAVVTNTDNVCLEAWANTGWRNYHLVAYNGEPNTNGYGFILVSNNYLAVLGGLGTVATIPCPPGEWMHLALVCSNGTVAVFANGKLAAVTNATPIAPSGNLLIGGTNSIDLGAYFLTSAVNSGYIDARAMDIKGFVDDVRLSTFASGAFNATDLLYAPSPVAQLSITRNGNNFVISAPANKTVARLQSTTNLGSPNWRNVDVPERLALQTIWTNTPSGAANFYRFDPAPSPVPVVLGSNDSNLPVPFWGNLISAVNEVYVDGNPDAESVFHLQIHDIDGSALNAEDDQSFDASASLDPLSETTNTLSFQYVLLESRAHTAQYDYYGGLADYYSPVLQIPHDSLPDLPDDGSDPDMGYWRVFLVIRHIPFTPNVGQKTVCTFRFIYLFSGMGNDPQYFSPTPPY